MTDKEDNKFFLISVLNTSFNTCLSNLENSNIQGLTKLKDHIQLNARNEIVDEYFAVKNEIVTNTSQGSYVFDSHKRAALFSLLLIKHYPITYTDNVDSRLKLQFKTSFIKTILKGIVFNSSNHSDFKYDRLETFNDLCYSDHLYSLLNSLANDLPDIDCENIDIKKLVNYVMSISQILYLLESYTIN